MNEKVVMWNQTMKYTVLFIGLLLSIIFLYTFRPLLGPLLIASLIAYLLNPLVGTISRRTRLSRRYSAVIVFWIFAGVSITLPALILPTAFEQFQTLFVDFDAIQKELQLTVNQQLVDWSLNLQITDDMLLGDNSIGDLFEPAELFRVIIASTTNLAWILIIYASLYYLLRDWPQLRDWLFHLPTPTFRDDFHRLFNEIAQIWRAYLMGQLWLMLIIGIASTIGSLAIGLSSPIGLGILAGILDIIPSLGPMIAMNIAIGVGFVEGSTLLPVSNTTFALVVLAVYGAIQIIENIWLRPKILGNSLKLHPGIIFVMVMTALALWGVLVTLIIIPLIGTIGVIGNYIWAQLTESQKG